MARSARLASIGVAVGAGVARPIPAQQVTFSVDWHGPTVSTSSVNGIPITEADLLRPPGFNPEFGPLPPPFDLFTGGQLGLSRYGICFGTPSGTGCGLEVDALSFGNEARFKSPGMTGARPRVYFSVDRLARGAASAVVGATVLTESARSEAAADVFVNTQTLQPPISPLGATGDNAAVLDGNGLAATPAAPRQRGVGLVEPHSSTPSTTADAGDNLDALELTPPTSGGRVYFSLDAGFPDQQLGGNNSNSAVLNGFAPSNVLVRPLGPGGITLYASATLLGLHPTNDDLDVLIIAENGIEGYQRSLTPFDWFDHPATLGPGAATDMLIYSVRRGSAIIGALDSLFGRAIAPGDLLTTPIGGVGNPAIFIPAEALGLQTTRSMDPQNDDLDAAAVILQPFTDCNGNGVEDAVDIATGASSDVNGNGIPDECEDEWDTFCDCPPALAPCGNSAVGTGCLNSFGLGGLLTASGSTSAGEDDLVLTSTNLSPGGSTLLFTSQTPTAVTFGDGVRCVGGTITRLGVEAADGLGTDVRGPGLYGIACPAGACWNVGETWYFQNWYRNAPAYCTSATYNLTNGVSIVFTP